MVVFYTVFLL